MKKQSAKIFFISLFLSFFLFSFSYFPFIIQKQKSSETKVETQEPYQAKTSYSFNSKILFRLEELNFYFILSLNSFKSETSLFLFSGHSIKDSAQKFSNSSPSEDCYNFFGERITKTVSISNEALGLIIDRLGGIIIKPIYGIKSPSNPEITISAGEDEEQVFGGAIIDILGMEKRPSYEQQLYCSNILLTVLKKGILNLDEDLFEDFINNCQTDISFSDFIDHKDSLKFCLDNFSATAAEGVWLNDEYFLK